MMPYATKPAPGNSQFDHEGQGQDHSVIGRIVQEHGPAIAHQHFSDGPGSHIIVTQHRDGHTHISTGHPDFVHAHEHIGIAHGEQ